MGKLHVLERRAQIVMQACLARHLHQLALVQGPQPGLPLAAAGLPQVPRTTLHRPRLAMGLAQERADTAEDLDATALALLDRLLVGPAGAVRETLALLDAAADGPDAGDQLAAERAAQLRRIHAMVAGEG